MKLNNLKIKLFSLFTGAFFWFNIKKAQALNFAEESGLKKTATNAGYPEGFSANPEGMIIQGISLVLSFVGVLFMILMIYGGFIWMTARGNESNVDRAKKIVTAGVIGLIIVFASYAISYFVVNFFSENSLK
jgi:hypothetical protein